MQIPPSVFCVPAAHGRHCAAAEAPTICVVMPAGQARQVPAPAVLLNVPRPQGTHTVRLALLMVPAGHSVHPWPGCGLMLPAGQARQSVALEALGKG